jgi:hypothetical protein
MWLINVLPAQPSSQPAIMFGAVNACCPQQSVRAVQ